MVISKVLNSFEVFAQMFFPPCCASCKAPLFGKRKAKLCDECSTNIDFLNETACRFCGAGAGDFATLDKGCTECEPQNLNFTRAVAVASYQTPVRELIHSFKFYGDRSAGKPMADCMKARLMQSDILGKVDLIIPVPLHKKRLKKRGYNQSEILATHLSSLTQIELDRKMLTRIRNTAAQSSLKRFHRLTNLDGAFAASRKLEGTRVLLVDDVLTTGATLSECATVLRGVGATRVYACVFAR